MFSKGTGKVHDILERRYNETLSGARRTWAFEAGKEIGEHLSDSFNRDKENQAWSEKRGEDGSIPYWDSVILRNRIFWLAACNRDLRTQYASGKDYTFRNPAHTRANHGSSRSIAARALDFFRNIAGI